MKYGFIRAHAQRWPVVHQCRLPGVQRSAYYDWRNKPCKVIPPEELALGRRMKALFRASRDSLGSRTLAENLREEGFKIGRDRTRRLMKVLSLKVKQKRKYKVTTDSKHQLPVAENVLNRQFTLQGPNEAWGTDITYLWTQQGWIYLALVIDVFTSCGGLGDGPPHEEGPGNPGLGDGDQSQEATTGADSSFGSWQPVCQSFLPGLAETAWNDLQYEPQR